MNSVVCGTFFAGFPWEERLKWVGEVMKMKKQLLAAFLCGTMLPLLVVFLAGFFKQPPAPVEPTVSPTEQTQQPQVQSYSDADHTVEVLQSSGEAEQMDLESYLEGVVLAEMPADFELEALKAQAVVARTYTCRRMNQGKHENASVCTDSNCCQGFRKIEDYIGQGGSNEAVDRIRKAVRETSGDVLTYQGQLIDATYFSCSGGFTEDAVAVWGKDVPYLQSVESPGEEEAPRFSDELCLSAQELADKLGVDGSGPLSEWFGERTRTEGGGVDTIEICGETFTGKDLRSKLGLRSTAFDVEVQGDTVLFETRGFGHRVGMSQYGAEAMAQDGKNYQEILAHYYQQTELENLESFMQ